MVTIISLWLPILLSAVFVFIISSVIHTVMTYHKPDFSKLPQEDDVMDALRKFDIPPSDYAVPYAGSSKAMNTPEYKEKLNKGPVGFMTVMPNGPWNMTSSLIQWFVYSVVVGIVVAYVTGRVVDGGADYLAVFRVSGTVAFACYSMALAQNSIWFYRSWGSTFRFMLDGLVYALLTAGTFGWLWLLRWAL